VDFRERCVSHSKGFDSFYVIVLKGGKKVYNKRLYIFYTQSTLVENNVTKTRQKLMISSLTTIAFHSNWQMVICLNLHKL